jgi:hypothetical protein
MVKNPRIEFVPTFLQDFILAIGGLLTIDPSPEWLGRFVTNLVVSSIIAIPKIVGICSLGFIDILARSNISGIP